MQIKGERWFLRRCYREVRRLSKFASLADRALELALGAENTQGHIKQAVGAVQLFLENFPESPSYYPGLLAFGTVQFSCQCTSL
jgi:hypothetical protein